MDTLLGSDDHFHAHHKGPLRRVLLAVDLHRASFFQKLRRFIKERNYIGLDNLIEPFRRDFFQLLRLFSSGHCPLLATAKGPDGTRYFFFKLHIFYLKHNEISFLLSFSRPEKVSMSGPPDSVIGIIPWLP